MRFCRCSYTLGYRLLRHWYPCTTMTHPGQFGPSGQTLCMRHVAVARIDMQDHDAATAGGLEHIVSGAAGVGLHIVIAIVAHQLACRGTTHRWGRGNYAQMHRRLLAERNIVAWIVVA